MSNSNVVDNVQPFANGGCANRACDGEIVMMGL